MSLSRQIEAALGAKVTRFAPLHGGDLSEVWRADLDDGRRVVAKTGAKVEVEARMLQALQSTGAPVPDVRHAEPGLLILRYLPETAPSPEGWAALGAALHALHGNTGKRYGWPEDYAFGPVAIPNAEQMNWPRFWAENRLLAAPDALPADLRRRLERLCARLPDLLPGAPPPSLLHGDLWSGNLLFTAETANLIDPACYHGDAEVDLAMLYLFGHPPAAFADAYGPLPPRFETRRAAYQLWPALVHLRLFGAGYRPMVDGLLEELGA